MPRGTIARRSSDVDIEAITYTDDQENLQISRNLVHVNGEAGILLVSGDQATISGVQLSSNSIRQKLEWRNSSPKYGGRFDYRREYRIALRGGNTPTSNWTNLVYDNGIIVEDDGTVRVNYAADGVEFSADNTSEISDVDVRWCDLASNWGYGLRVQNTDDVIVEQNNVGVHHQDQYDWGNVLGGILVNFGSTVSEIHSKHVRSANGSSGVGAAITIWDSDSARHKIYDNTFKLNEQGPILLTVRLPRGPCRRDSSNRRYRPDPGGLERSGDARRRHGFRRLHIHRRILRLRCGDQTLLRPHGRRGRAHRGDRNRRAGRFRHHPGAKSISMRLRFQADTDSAH